MKDYCPADYDGFLNAWISVMSSESPEKSRILVPDSLTEEISRRVEFNTCPGVRFGIESRGCGLVFYFWKLEGQDAS